MALKKHKWHLNNTHMKKIGGANYLQRTTLYIVGQGKKETLEHAFIILKKIFKTNQTPTS